MSTKHSEDGIYKAVDLLTPEMRDMTLEQVLMLLVYKIAQHSDDIEAVFASMPRRKLLDFDVHPTDRGPILGREGYIIQALRTIAKAILGPDCKEYRYSVDLTSDSISQHSIE